MASKARKSFDENLDDIERLIDYYETVEKIFKNAHQPLPDGYDVVLRSAIVLLVTYWEAYIEDIVSEAVTHLVKNIKDPRGLPKEGRNRGHILIFAVR